MEAFSFSRSRHRWQLQLPARTKAAKVTSSARVSRRCSREQLEVEGRGTRKERKIPPPETGAHPRMRSPTSTPREKEGGRSTAALGSGGKGKAPAHPHGPPSTTFTVGKLGTNWGGRSSCYCLPNLEKHTQETSPPKGAPPQSGVVVLASEGPSHLQGAPTWAA